MKDKLNMKTKKKIKITNVTPKKTTKPKEPKYYTFKATWERECPPGLTTRDVKHYNSEIARLENRITLLTGITDSQSLRLLEIEDNYKKIMKYFQNYFIDRKKK